MPLQLSLGRLAWLRTDLSMGAEPLTYADVSLGSGGYGQVFKVRHIGDLSAVGDYKAQPAL